MRNQEPSRTPFGYLVSAAINGVLLWAVNRLPVWNPFFLLQEKYGEVLWALNMMFIVQIALNVVLVFFHPLFFHYLANTIASLVSIVAFSMLLQVFPVDFSARVGPWANTLFRVVVIIALAGSAIGGAVSFVRFLRTLFSRPATR
jgi:hypothetical protein